MQNMNTDRYILNRDSLNIDESSYWLHRSTLKEGIDRYRKTTALSLQDVRQPEKIEYINQLRRVFNINENRCSILPLTSLPKSINFNEFENQWPVRPRSKPVYKSQLAVLDLPSIRNDICSNITDWTSNNHIVAALGKVIWIWNVSNSRMFHHIDCYNEVIALKSDANSSLVAFSCKDEAVCSLKVWHFETHKVTTKIRPLGCHHASCWITCIEFHVSMKHIIIGCKRGNIGALDINLNRLVTVRNAHSNLDIIKVKASPNGRYVASSGYDGFVNIWSFPDFHLTYSYFQTYCSRGLSWHPWKSSYLCVGTSNGLLALLNASLGKCVYSKREANTIIYEVSFNKLSAELVVSQTYCEPANPESYVSQINVLANFNHVVDRFEGHSKRVLFIEWSPDNQILATAGSDETIHLWHFFEKKHKTPPQNIVPCNRFNFENYIR